MLVALVYIGYRARMTLVEYLKQTKRSQSHLAKAVGVQRGTISHLVTGFRLPSLSLAIRIERECGVPVETWKKRKAK